jgi:adenylyltransferase/sulfurtransferase
VGERLDPERLDRRLAQLPVGSVVLECTDDSALKFAANDLCLQRGIDLVVAGVLAWSGHALAVRRGAACLRCIFEEPPPPALAPACDRVGVMGSAAGMLGHLMALLAARMLAGEQVAGELIVADLLSTRVRALRPAPRRDCLACAGRSHIDHSPRACAPAS